VWMGEVEVESGPPAKLRQVLDSARGALLTPCVALAEVSRVKTSPDGNILGSRPLLNAATYMADTPSRIGMHSEYETDHSS